MRTAIKITLNSSVVFDAAILDYLKGKKNKAGQIKQLAYDRLVSLASGTQANGHQERAGFLPPVSGIDEDNIDRKLNKLSNF